MLIKENEINPKILKHCREQMALSVENAQKKASLKTLSDIEEGHRQPTLKQIEKLSQLYLVPTWVFMKSKLPSEYDFSKTLPSFRKFKNSQGDNFNYKLRFLTTKVENFRKTIINLKEEMKEPIPKFNPPDIKLKRSNIIDASKSVRIWLNNEQRSFEFREWRKQLENSGIFVFLTSSFSGWSKIEPEVFRGLSIYYDKLPIIIINNSDTYKAKSFTLFHELGHLLSQKTILDRQIGTAISEEEKICDNFAGEILMPKDKIIPEYKSQIDSSKSLKLKNIENLSTIFKTSTYATLVRLKSLNLINQAKYKELQELIIQHHESIKDKDRKLRMITKEGIPRVMHREALIQYGKIYSETVMQAYLNKDITLYKARNMFGLKKTKYILKMMKKIS